MNKTKLLQLLRTSCLPCTTVDDLAQLIEATPEEAENLVRELEQIYNSI